MAKPSIAVVMGGRSAEREISLQTGGGVLRALQFLGYDAWSLDYSDSFVDVLQHRRPDAVFNALHGGAGEDGTVAALLEWLEIPYQGSGVRASAIAMDKWTSKALMFVEQIPVARGLRLTYGEASQFDIARNFGLPCVVKPVAEGSAVGVSVVRTPEEWQAALRAAAPERGSDAALLIEEYIAGREFTVAVLGDEALPVVEITPHDGFYTYFAKYTAGASTHTVPARLPADVAEQMQLYGRRLHTALGCRDYSRSDMLLDSSGRIAVLECNTLPGLTPLSLFPDAARAAGIQYENLVQRLILCALARSRGSVTS